MSFPNGFIPINRCDERSFQTFQQSHSFADTTFAMLYAWQNEFNYHVKAYENAIVIGDMNQKGNYAFMLLHNDLRDIVSIISELYDLCKANAQSLVIDYIHQKDLELYQVAVDRLDLSIELSTDRIYDDYIYKTEDFINMSGNSNRTKRGSYNNFIRNFPECHCKEYSDDMRNDIMGIFDCWCERQICDHCFYGCEKKAFENFLKIYDKEKHMLNVAYNGDLPLSFAVCERINKDTVSYYFQKNAVGARGLTYYLNREMALKHLDIKYINLGEDMGLIGLKNDKKNLHPCCMMKKYTLIIDL